MATVPSSGFLRGARVLTLDPRFGGDALRWEEGRIVEVGVAGDLLRRVPRGTPQYDLPGALITPGFVDAHTHLAMWALGRRQVQLVGAASLVEALARIRRAVPEDGWVVGQGWDANDWEAPPDREALDRAQAVPAFLSSLDVHAAWVNTAGLRAAGITAGTPDPFGGRIVRDAAGEPTGLLLERAVELVRSVLPPPRPDRLDAALLAAQAEAHRLGITGVHNVENRQVYDAFRRLASSGRLRLRVLFHHPVADLEQLIASGIRSGGGGPWLREGGVKLFLDGSLGSRTAWMLEPYDGTRDRGMPISDGAKAREAVSLAAAHGIAATVHAIGDAAVRRALDLMEGLPSTAISHRIEHFQCVHPADLGRAARLGTVLSMQPAHILADIPLAERHWGRRSGGAYAFRSLVEGGAVLAFGSDAPVASLDPREGVFAAMERRQDDGQRPWYPDQRLDFETVVRSYTLGPALAAGLAGTRGTLQPGGDADLVAWHAGDEPVTGSSFRQARVLLTVVGGEAVYNSPVVSPGF